MPLPFFMDPEFCVDREACVLGPGFRIPGSVGIATAIPGHELVVTGPGTHWTQIERAADFLAARGDIPAFSPERLIPGAVSLYMPGDAVQIRAIPEDMELTFAADRLIQKLGVDKSLIHFLGLEQSAVRRALRSRGQSWRMAPPPLTPKAVAEHIQKSRVRVATEVNYHYNPTTGVRILTCQEFRRIGSLLILDREDALARLTEISDLAFRKNRGGYPEMTFFLAPGRSLDPGLVEDLHRAVREAGQGPDRVISAYRDLGEAFLVAAGELADDYPDNPAWRSAMFLQVSNLQEARLEESALGLSPEFHLNIRWLPGASIVKGRAEFDPQASDRAKNLILHFQMETPDLVSINLGRVESPLTGRITTGQEREVLVAAVESKNAGFAVHLLREIKWNVAHRIKKNIPLPQAITETYAYRDYIIDRLAAIRALGIPIPVFTEIGFQEAGTYSLPVPVYYFGRPYVPGAATDKVPCALYRVPGFVLALARLLGFSAAVSMALGRADSRTDQLFFDDGDEMVQLDEAGIPRRIFLAETTGSFHDTWTPLAGFVPTVAGRMARRMAEALECGAPDEEILAAAQAFGQGLAGEMERLKQGLASQDSPPAQFFSHRTDEARGIRRRWEAVLARLAEADPPALGLLAQRMTLEALSRQAFQGRGALALRPDCREG